MKRTCLWSFLMCMLVLSTVASSAAFSQEEFNAEVETNAIDGREMTKIYGPMENLKYDFKELRVGYVVKTLANECWSIFSDGVRDYLSDYAITLDLQSPKSESDQAEQLQIVESMLNKDYDILILSPQSNTTLDPAVREANKMGILVINAFDAQIADAKCLIGYLSTDTGLLAAEYIAKFANGKGKVACIEGLAGAHSAIYRTEGFHKGVAKFPDLDLVASIPADWDRQVAMDVATDLINQHGEDLKGIYCNNDTMALGAIEAVKSAGLLGKICVIGTDGITGAYESIKNGELTGTVDLNLYEGGKMTAEASLRIKAGQDLARVVKIPQRIADITNYKEYEYVPKTK